MRALLVAALLLPASLAAAQTGKISGVVTDAASGEPMPGVNVVIAGTTTGSATDAEGRYFILNITPGSYALRASMVGYQTVEKQEVVVNLNRTTTVDFAMPFATFEGEEITVTAERPDVVRERTSSSEIVRMSDVESAPGVRDLSDVLALTADVVDGHFRGGRQGEELYNLSGMAIVNPLTNARAFVPIMSGVEEVEVITSGFSAQYGNAQSGVVNISMKEGNRERWEGHLEGRTRTPGYKHFGGSVFSVDANPYLQILDTPEEWAGTDPVTDRVFYDLTYGFTTHYPDSAVAASIAYGLWKQARRDLNREYDNTWDGSMDLSLGGPLSSHSRLFLAGRYENEWLALPTDTPDKVRQVMGNVVYELRPGLSLRFSGALDTRRGTDLNGLGSRSYSNFRYWMWDRLIGSSKYRDRSLQLGVRLAHTLSARTFYELKFNTLSTSYRLGADVLDPTGSRDDADAATWRYFNTPDFFRVGYTENDFVDEATRTYTVDGYITSQVTNNHMIMAGLQANRYDVDVQSRRNLSSAVQSDLEFYKAKPFEWALFFTDKMEFGGMIANVGLRLDGYDQNIDYYTDIFQPLRNPGYDPTQPPVGENKPRDPSLAARAKTDPVLYLQPRVGVSFPISVSTVFHLNYGSFLQRPSFERTIFTRVDRANLEPIRLGNPRLKPEKTQQYEVGLAQGLGEGFTLDLSGYYKDVKNLVELAYFQPSSLNLQPQETFINVDYADIRGFRISLNKRRGAVTGAVRYNYGIATGKNMATFDAPPVYFENEQDQPSTQLANLRDVLLDFDRTHNTVLQLAAHSPAKFGPRIAGFRPLGGIDLSLRSSVRSGRPYTYNTEGLALRNNRRAPMEYNTDLKLTRRFKTPTARGTVYAEVFNVFNQRLYDYDVVFRNRENITKYEEDRDALRYFDQDVPFLADQSFLIYGNRPRSIFLGMTIDF